jgi:hypothetical protein
MNITDLIILNFYKVPYEFRKHITNLNLCRNLIENIYSIYELFPNLTILSLDENNISDIGGLINFKKLKHLQLNDNKIDFTLMLSINYLQAIVTNNTNSTGVINNTNSTGVINNTNSTGVINNTNSTGVINNTNSTGVINNKIEILFFDMIFQINKSHPMVESYTKKEIVNDEELFETFLDDIII